MNSGILLPPSDVFRILKMFYRHIGRVRRQSVYMRDERTNSISNKKGDFMTMTRKDVNEAFKMGLIMRYPKEDIRDILSTI